MDLLGDLAGSRKLTGYRCFMHRLRAENPALAEQAERGINSTIPADLVAEWLRDHDAGPISGQSIRNHRTHKCATCLILSQT